jgi:hypothetical protein
MAMILKRMEFTPTVRGFRSTLRDSFPREVAEQALAHKIGGVEGDYRRSDALKKRRELMELWARYLDGGPGGGARQRTPEGRRRR